MVKKILLLGSGELGKEFVIAAQRLGQNVVAVDSYEGAPAMQVADAFGLEYLIHIARSSSRRPACYSVRYPSIDYFKELV